MNAAKWIKLQVLLSHDEMRELLGALQPFYLYRVGTVLPAETALVSPEKFLADYALYLEAVKAGKAPNTRPFALVLTKDPGTMTTQPLPGEREIVRPCYPSIQMQPHDFQFDQNSLSCRSMVYGIDSIPWGVQLSYPHLFEDPTTHEIQTVDDRFVNTPLFRQLRLFIRNQTRPTPLNVMGKKVNIPVRLGKQCFEWIESYPWTKKRGLDVITS